MKVLLVDDEPDFLEQAKVFLKEINGDYEIETARSVEEGLQCLRTEDFECIVSDYKMPEKDGLDFLENVRSQGRNIPFIIITGKGDEGVAMRSTNLGVENYFVKSGEPKKLFKNLSKAIRQVLDRRRRKEYLVAWVGKNAPIRRFATKTLVGVDKDRTVRTATERMVSLGISSLVVFDGDEIIGFFTDNDVKRKVTARGLKPDLPVEEIMETKLITIDISSNVGEAMEKMSKRNIKHLLTEEKENINGILTFGDIIGMEINKPETYISRE